MAARAVPPVVGPGDDDEAGSGQGVSDTPDLELDTEEVDVVDGDGVEPVDGGAVLIADLGGEEDGGMHLVEATSVGEKFTEVVVVGSLQLVLDDDAVLVREGAADDVGAEAAHGHFDAIDGELEADGVAEEGDVGVLGQPGGEVSGLTGPVVAWREFL